MKSIYIKMTWRIVGLPRINKAIKILINNNVSFNCTVENYNRRPEYKIYVELKYIISRRNKVFDIVTNELRKICI